MPYVSGITSALLLFIILTVALTWPLSRHPATRVLWAGADTELFMWTLAWDAHAFVTSPLGIFNANIFAPEPRTLAYSEHLIGSAVFAAPVLWLTGNPVLAMNVAALLTVVLCGLGAYVLARRIGIGHAGALIAGIVFAFSPPRFFRLGQLHLTAVQWVPFGLAFFHAYLDDRRRRDLWLAAACVTLQALSSGHGTIFLGVAMAALVAWRGVTGQRVEWLRMVRDLHVPGALLLGAVILVAIPYRIVQDEMGLRRSLVDWAVNAQSYLASPSHVQRWLLDRAGAGAVNDTASAFLFPGFLPLLLAAGAVWGLRTRQDRGQRGRASARAAALVLTTAAVGLLGVAAYVSWVGPIRFRAGGILFSARDAWRPWLYAAVAIAARAGLARWVPLDFRGRARQAGHMAARLRAEPRASVTAFYLALTLLCVLLSIGPPFGIWPLVYWLPGLNFIRVPSRFVILAILGIAMLAGMAIDALRRRVRGRRGTALCALIGAAIVCELAVAPLDTTAYRFAVPAADYWLATRPGPFTIAEFPAAGTPGALPAARQQTVYMLHSTAHWQKTIHGYSGIEPTRHTALYAQLRSFPSEESLAALRAWGVKYVVVHPELYPRGEWQVAEARLARFAGRLRQVHAAAADRIYELD